jgi:hypothetical protein
VFGSESPQDGCAGNAIVPSSGDILGGVADVNRRWSGAVALYEGVQLRREGVEPTRDRGVAALDRGPGSRLAT